MSARCRRAAGQTEPARSQRLVAVVGPTASGKSGLALRLAERCGGEILNTDSLQVYRHFDIGTAKPTVAERARVPHHLLDCVEPEETYSAGRYVSDAQSVLAELGQRERVPVLCGGTGLYFRALLFRLAEVPPVPEAVRREVQARLAALGPAACHAELARIDPETAARVHPNDRVRIARGLEVFLASGRPLSRYHRERPFLQQAHGVLSVGVHWERARLYERIGERVEAMLTAGWIAEVEGLLAKGYDPGLKPFQAIGYREIVAMLQGRRPREGLAAAIATRTRQYAKRQLTWFRKHPDVVWAEPGEEERLVKRVEVFLRDGS
jgi:tRNA dimethylallyltransferase